MLRLQFRSYASQNCHRETLWPTMSHQQQTDKKRKSLVLRKPYLCAAAGRFVAKKGEPTAL